MSRDGLDPVLTAVLNLPTGQRAALATVVSTRGSTPRKAGTRMLVLPDEGTLVGTVGGGCGEAEVIEAARAAVADSRPRTVKVDLTEDLLSWSPAVCGGVMEVVVEPLVGGAARTQAQLDGTSPLPVEAGPFVHIHYRRPPDGEQVYVQRLIAVEEGALITLARDLQFDPPMMIEGEVALERGSVAIWFTFPDTWHDIGIFHRADGTVSGVYANILTPPALSPHPAGYRWDTTDLFLDVWMPAGGGHALLDVDQFHAAEAEGAMPDNLARQAEREAGRILRELEAGQWPPPLVGQWTLERALAEEGRLIGAGAPREVPG